MNKILPVSILLASFTLGSAHGAPVDGVTASRNSHEAELETPTHHYVDLSVSALPIGAGAILAAPVVPVSASVNLGAGFSIGGDATFSGKFKYQDADYGLTGFGGHVTWVIGHDAMESGFFVQGFYHHYSVSASKSVPLDGALGNFGNGGFGNGGGFDNGNFGNGGGFGNGGFGQATSDVADGSPNMGSMSIPMEGSVPVNSYGGMVGYQWIWGSGFKLSAGVRMAYFASNAHGITLMGQNVDELRGSSMSQVVQIPVIKDQSQWIPMPEISLGWAI